jgi:hypothetical protein
MIGSLLTWLEQENAEKVNRYPGKMNRHAYKAGMALIDRRIRHHIPIHKQSQQWHTMGDNR